jgi:NAD(P)-dependent dehydrogenase (short-subunit alcohol dehydrogenase family)
MIDLSGGVAIVTGGGGAGSGRAIARRLARAGSSVVIADVNDAGAGETADIIAGERGTAVVAYVDWVPPEHRRDRGVPERLLTTDEVAGAVFALATSSNLAGGVLLLRNEEPPALIAAGDPGYSRLEPVSFALT